MTRPPPTDGPTGVRFASDFQVFGSGNVRPHRVRFDPADPAFLSRSADGSLIFRVLGPPEAAVAMVVVRHDDVVAGHPLSLLGTAGATSLWEGVVVPPAPSFAYSIALRLEDEEAGPPVYLAPTGVASGIERLDRFEVVVADVPAHEAPSWAAGTVIYQIFPDRFADGDPVGHRDGVEAWDTPPTDVGFKGGDLIGITSRVDHLVELGVGAVYLNPVFASPSNHRYDAVDYLQVDPMLGGDDALGALVETLHRHDIRIILDVSLNHVHPRFFAFADLIDNGPDSAYAGWFAVREWPIEVRYRPTLVEPGGFEDVHLDRLRQETDMAVVARSDAGPPIETTYESWYGVPTMPRVNLQHPAARRYMLDVATHWVRRLDIDGWRMDVVRYIDHDFWIDLRREIRAVRPDAYLLAEVMGDARRWLAGDEFDATMNYTFRELCVDYLAEERIGTPVFLEGLLEMTAMYSPAVTAMNHNLLGSHDMPRFLTVAGGDERSLLLATLLQLTLPGAPGLYYGDEVPMAGGGDPDNRRAMAWDRLGGPHHRAVADLVGLRRDRKALRTGSWRLLGTVGDAFAYERLLGDERVVVAMNRGRHRVSLAVPRLETVLWSTGSAEVTAPGLTLGPRSAVVVA